MMKLKIPNSEVQELLSGKKIQLPKVRNANNELSKPKFSGDSCKDCWTNE
jgi:hypothetical protein